MTITANNWQAHNGSSFSYTPSSVSNAVLVAFAYSEDVGNDSPITGMTFGGTGMTAGPLAESVLGSNSNDVGMFYLASPGTSAATLAVTGGSGEGRIKIIAVTLGGTATLSIDGSGTATVSSGTSISDALTASASGMALSGIVKGTESAWAPDYGTLGAGDNTFGSSLYAGASYESVSSGAVSTGWSGASDDRIGLASVIFVESGGFQAAWARGINTVL